MQDRGMKKWRAFASIPEQYVGLQEMIDKQSEIPKPLLTEDQMEQINQVLVEALHTNQKVYLTCYKHGKHIIETGFIQFVDPSRDIFMFTDESSKLKKKMKLSEVINIQFV
ncbi:YolD-like family protein [Priestia endophytica]|uniref:YolD-like family protein n=1 Tax=Priestia endophytica TaxID=135735 RepID=UPI003D2E495D